MSKTLQRGFVMKKRIIPILTIALSLLCASVCDAYYLLRLKNRGMVTTPAYWFEGNKIHFYVSGGIASLERREIDKIEDLEKEVSDYRQRTAAIQVKKETPSAPPDAEKAKEPEKPSAEGEPNSEKSLSAQTPSEKMDLKPYVDKMTSLKAEANRAQERLRTAIKDRDLAAEAEAAADRRKISAEMQELTNELKEKNNGELPAGWFDRVGL